MGRASTTPLSPGENSIARATPQKTDKGVRIYWTLKKHDGTTVRKHTQARTVGEARRRAYETAQTLLDEQDAVGPFRLDSKVADYIERVSAPAVEHAALRPNTLARYRAVLRALTGACKHHEHLHALAGRTTIRQAQQLRTIEACLSEIADLHGSESARQARNVASKYLYDQLARDGLLVAGDPLRGRRLDLRSSKPANGPSRGGVALSEKGYLRTVDHLLGMDTDTRQGGERWSATWKRARAVDLTLLQASSGLRVSEANAITWDDVRVAKDGLMSIEVSPEVSKTKRGRTAQVFDKRVAQRLLDHRDPNGIYVIGAPMDRNKQWDVANCRQTIADLYKLLSEELKIDELATARSHVWRTTLNMILMDKLPDAVRSAQFGHTVAVNQTRYTDTHKVAVLESVARQGITG